MWRTFRGTVTFFEPIRTLFNASRETGWATIAMQAQRLPAVRFTCAWASVMARNVEKSWCGLKTSPRRVTEVVRLNKSEWPSPASIVTEVVKTVGWLMAFSKSQMVGVLCEVTAESSLQRLHCSDFTAKSLQNTLNIPYDKVENALTGHCQF